MNKKIISYFEIAAELTLPKKNDRRSYCIGAIAIRNDGAMVRAINSAVIIPDRKLHAEYKLSNKLDAGSTVYVVRVRLIDGKFGIARPCNSCQKVLRSKRVDKIYYTISPNEYGVLLPDNEKLERIFTNSNLSRRKFL